MRHPQRLHEPNTLLVEHAQLVSAGYTVRDHREPLVERQRRIPLGPSYGRRGGQSRFAVSGRSSPVGYG